jgi:hypothetical protein
MVATKPDVNRYRNTEGMPRRHEVIISRLRMGYKNLTHGYRKNDEIRPLCTDCNQDITVEHILWQCPNYDIQRSRSNISIEILGNNQEEAKGVIKYLKKYQIPRLEVHPTKSDTPRRTKKNEKHARMTR